MKHRSALLALLAVCPALVVQAAPADSKAFDALVSRHYVSGKPGAAVLVKQGDKVLLRKGYGLANVELGVPVKPEHVFRIGSTTKTFTSVAVMQLVEEGKLALDAPLSRYLKDAPKTWEKVSVEHLLTHTSGIPSYTSDIAFLGMVRKDLTVDELIATFKDKLLDFEPGTKWAYNNSGYILLGKLIETVTGKDYYANLKTRVIEPLGLKHTGYGDEGVLIPGMVNGYKDGPVPASYISMTLPYAAGALVSNVDDLATFTLALHGGKLLKPASYQRMITPYKTSDGKDTRYGYGLFARTSNGRTLLGHGGDIFGFHCQVEADPAAKTVAVILHNGERLAVDGGYLSRRLLGQATGYPLPEPKPIAVSPAQLAVLVGTYASSEGTRIISLNKGTLVSRMNGGRSFELKASNPTTFFVEGNDLRLRFSLENGKATSVQKYEDGGELSILAKRQGEDAGPKAIAMAPEAFDTFVGEYQLAPTFSLKIFREGARFLAQATGQDSIEILAEGKDAFFSRAVPVRLVFQRDPADLINGLVLEQGGRKMPAKKVK